MDEDDELCGPQGFGSVTENAGKFIWDLVTWFTLVCHGGDMPTVASGEHLFMCWCTIMEHLHHPFAILLCSICTK